MREPKEKRCKWCGRRILWVQGQAGPFPVDAPLVPYRRAQDGERGRRLFRNTGAIINDVVITTDEDADGFAHEIHGPTCRRPASPPRKNDTRPGMKKRRWDDE